MTSLLMCEHDLDMKTDTDKFEFPEVPEARQPISSLRVLLLIVKLGGNFHPTLLPGIPQFFVPEQTDKTLEHIL